jgi:hypothetical protein
MMQWLTVDFGKWFTGAVIIASNSYTTLPGEYKFNLLNVTYHNVKICYNF